jgi:hypothetical protein
VLVVEHGDGLVVTRCVAFDADQITGEELLNSSGIAWSAQTFGGFGDAVCALDGEPAQYADCPGKDRYWAVFVARAGGSWQLANVGISTMTLSDGDAEGFRYVPASGVPAVPVSAAGACAAVAATPTPAPPAAATPRPSRAAAATVPPSGAAATAATAAAMTTTTVAPASGATPTDSAPTASGTAAPSATASQTPTPAPSGGLDLGLMVAALTGGGLAGLALLRLLGARRNAS